MEETDPLIGETIAGYEVIDVLGRGGMGVVYKAKQVSLDRIVALKILPGQFATDQEYIQRFQKEARAAARLNHHNIIQIYDFGLIGQLHYLAMEYIDGSPLSSYLKAYGRIQENDCLQIMMQACEALDCAHKSGIIHRDIKPDNILLSNAGEVKLCDLGLAKLTVGEDLSLTQTGMAVGTPYYISPEQVRGDKVLDPRTDIYSLGATIYHLLTGRIPFDGPSSAVVMSRHLTDALEDPRLLQPDISYETTCVIYKMMSKSPEDRYGHIGEAYHEIKKILEKPATQEPPPPESVEKFVIRKNQESQQSPHSRQSSISTQPTPVSVQEPPSPPNPSQTPPPDEKAKLKFKESPSTKTRTQTQTLTQKKKKSALMLILFIFIVIVALMVSGLLAYFYFRDNKSSAEASSQSAEQNQKQESLPPDAPTTTPEKTTTVTSSLSQNLSDVRSYRRISFASITPDPLHSSNIPLVSDQSRIICSVEKPNPQMFENLRKHMLSTGKRLKATLLLPFKIKGDQPVDIFLYALKKPVEIIPQKIKQVISEGGVLKDNRPGLLPGKIRENLANAAAQQTSWTIQSNDTPWELPGANGTADREFSPLGSVKLNSSTPEGLITCDISDDFAKFLADQNAFLDFILITESPSGAATLVLDPASRVYPKIEIE